jgi:hypothetical protein
MDLVLSRIYTFSGLSLWKARKGNTSRVCSLIEFCLLPKRPCQMVFLGVWSENKQHLVRASINILMVAENPR